MPNASSGFPATLDTMGGGAYDGSVQLAIAQIEAYAAPTAPSAITVLGQTIYDENATSNLQLTSGVLYLTSIQLPSGLAIKNLSVCVSVASSANITHGWMGIFDGAYKVRAATADVVTGATTAAGTLWTLPIATTASRASTTSAS